LTRIKSRGGHLAAARAAIARGDKLVPGDDGGPAAMTLALDLKRLAGGRAKILAVLAGAALTLSSCLPERGPQRLCERLIQAFAERPAAVAILQRDIASGPPYTVSMLWQAGEDARPARLICRFGPVASDGTRRLAGVWTDAYGDLGYVQLVLLLRSLGIPGHAELEAARADAPQPPPWTLRKAALYLLQQTVNALTLGCIYALIALGYTLVYGIIGVINFAYGEIHMIGAFLVVTAFALVGNLGVVALPAAALAAMGLAGAYGYAADRLVFRPLRRAPPVTPLIAAIGLSIALQEYVRLVRGARGHWLGPVLGRSHAVAEADGFAVYLSEAQLTIGLMTAGALLLLWLLVQRTPFGRKQRACAQDRLMASMVGVDVDRIVASTFVLGSAFAALAGLIVALHFGGVNFVMGTLVGFKALTAAILGGIGSLPGAVVGGFAIALIETFWSAYLASEFKDVAVFAVLVGTLVLHPTGLLGGYESRLPGERPRR
jgi:branched-chain amino acid transport system permease protein